jgi:hypothetical protein
LWVYSLNDKKATVLADAPTAPVLGWSAFSPDGHWIAYESPETKTGLIDVWVQPFPPTGARQQISTDGAIHPFWSSDGKELFFLTRVTGLDAVSINTRPTFTFGTPARVPAPFANLGRPLLPRNLDITPDGKLLGVTAQEITSTGTVSSPLIQVVLNWFEDVKQRMSPR